MEKKNITPEGIEDSEVGKEYTKKVNSFDAKNYLNVRLDKGEESKSMKIRLLTIDKDSNRPFEHIHMHTVRVPEEISKSGWKSYVCLKKTSGPFSEKLGTKCPFCELREEAYKKFKEAQEEGNTVDAERYKEISKSMIPQEVSIIRCIERGHEEDGPKFWKFNLRSDKKDPENIIRKLYKTKIEECKELGVEPENIMDLDNGRDLKVTVEAVYDKSGKKTNKVAVDINIFGDKKPLTTNDEQYNNWVNNEKVWSDVFVAKPYDYLEVILDGGTPWYDKNTGRWIPKKVFEKNTGIEPEDLEADKAAINNAVENVVSKAEVKDSDIEELPF